MTKAILFDADMDKNFISWAEKQLGSNSVASKMAYGDQSTVYKLDTPNSSYFLKIDSVLENERKHLEWLQGRLPVPKVIGFTHIEDKDALLLSAILGDNLAELSKKWTPDKVINKLTEALRQFHSFDPKVWPFEKTDSGKVLLHGDACLTNFIFQNDMLSGYIDLGDMLVGNPDIDLSAAVWSLQYNLGKGYGLKFLEEYGIKNANEELVEKLRLQYEEAQRKWGLKDNN